MLNFKKYNKRYTPAAYLLQSTQAEQIINIYSCQDKKDFPHFVAICLIENNTNFLGIIMICMIKELTSIRM